MPGKNRKRFGPSKSWPTGPRSRGAAPVSVTPVEPYVPRRSKITTGKRAVTGPDEDGFQWVRPSPTINPMRPRTQVIGYNPKEAAVRTVFRDGTTWRYNNVTPEEWTKIRRGPSTGRFIARVLDYHDHGAESF